MNKKQIKRIYNVAIIAVIVLALGYVCSRFVHWGNVEYTNDAQVWRHITPLNARVGGFIKEIRFEDYQHVSKGDTLVIIEDAEYQLQLAQAEAQLKGSRSGSSAVSAGMNTTASNVRVASAGIEEARVNMENARADYERYAALLEKDAVTRQQYDNARARYEAAKARYEQASQQRQSTALIQSEQAQRLSQTHAGTSVAEVMNATPHALQNTLTGGVLHWGFTTTGQFYVFEILGYAFGCIFTILWGKGYWGRIPRFATLFSGGSKFFTLHSSLFTFKYTRLLTVGFAALLMYQVLMYFYVAPTLNVERLWLPTFLRTFGYGIFFSTMTIYLKDLIEFPTFFMALTVSGFIRNGVAESVCTGLYRYGLRHQIADALSRGIHSDYVQVLMVAVKEMFGLMCLIGTFTLLLMLLYDVQPVRSTMKRMMPLKTIGQLIRRSMATEGHEKVK